MKFVNRFVLVVALSWVVNVQAEEQVFSSSKAQTGVIELYTSEGCSSCPPADKWLSSLKENPDLWEKIIPVAFHVDYWDYIGWKDRFAMPKFTQRQRLYARQQSLNTIYTPGFVYNGQEWRNWFLKRFFDFPEGKMPGKLSLHVNSGTASVNFMPVRPQNAEMTYNLALLGFGIKTKVQAGENSGRTLNHDFVVLDMKQGVLRPGSDGFVANTRLPESDISARQYALVAWLNRANDLSPIQATGGYLKARN